MGAPETKGVVRAEASAPAQAAPARASQTGAVKYEIRETARGEVVRTPYGSVLVGMNSVVVKLGESEVPMPVRVAEALFGYKQGG